MAATLLPNGKQQFEDINGAPLVGGKVYHYIPDTTTPKDTWQDRDQATLNDNPLTLDERGQAVIWGVGLYRQRVLDADGNLIWDQETIAPQLGAGGEAIFFDTLADFTTADLASTVTTVYLNGYYATGDGGAQELVRITPGGSGPGRHQNTDGSWWEIANEALNSNQFGAKGDFDDAACTTLAQLSDYTDNQVALQEMLSVLAARGGGEGTIAVSTDGGQFLLMSQIKISSNCTLRIAAGCTIWRGWKTAGSNKGYATLININHLNMANFIVNPGPYDWEAASQDENISVYGPGGFNTATVIRTAILSVLPTPTEFAGPNISFVGVFGVQIENLTCAHACREWSFNMIANDGVFGGNWLFGGDQLYEDGFHLQGGHRWRIFGNHMGSGDDAYAFGSNYNLAISHVNGAANTGRSEQGHLIRVLQFREGSTLGYAPSTEFVEDIVFSAVGEAGLIHGGCIRFDNDTGAPYQTRNVNLTFDVKHGVLADHDGVNAQGVSVLGGQNITLNGIVRTPVRQGVVVRRTATNVVLNLTVEAPQDSGYQTIDLDTVGVITLTGQATCGNRAAILADDTTRLNIANFDAYEIPTSYGMVRGTGVTYINSAGGVSAHKAVGATATYAYGVESATVTIQRSGDDTTGVDAILGATTGSFSPVAYFPGAGNGTTRTRTITSGAVAYKGESVIKLLCEGGVSDTISTLTLAPDGVQVIFQSGELLPAVAVVTVNAGTGANNFNIGVNHALDTDQKGNALWKQGGVWQEISEW